MPLYEYRCRECERTFEVIQKFSDPELTECRDCGGPVERLLSAPAIQFKGSGWYVTDYGRSGSAGSRSAKNGDGGGDSKKSSGEDSSTSSKD